MPASDAVLMIEPYRGEAGFELIAQAVGVERPKKLRGAVGDHGRVSTDEPEITSGARQSSGRSRS